MHPQLRFDNDAPWKKRYRLPITYGLEIAAQAPDRGLVLSNYSGVYQLYGWDIPAGNLIQATFNPKGVYQQGAISPDGRFLYYLDDNKGNEVGHFVRVPFAERAEAEDITPDFPFYGSLGCVFSRCGNRLGFIMTSQDGFALYSMPVAPGGVLGAPEQHFRSEHLTMTPSFDFTGEMMTIMTADQPGGNYRLLAFDVLRGELCGQLADANASVEGGRFSPISGDMRLLATSDRSGAKRPLIWDVRTGERCDLALGDLEGEIIATDWSPDGKHLLLCQFWQAKQQLYRYDLLTREIQRLQHPSGSFLLDCYFSPDGDIYAHLENATTPLQLRLLDGKTGMLKQTVFPVGEFPESRPWRSVSFSSSDGQTIQGWLGVPEGTGPFPSVIDMHGGPEWVKIESFDPAGQSWLDAGFAFLSLNYRGSTTFGKAFQEHIRGNLGEWEVEDMVAARQWLIEQGIASAEKVFLTGWSYGGYLTLLALGKRPTLWAGGMAGAAFGDFVVAYEDEGEMLKALDRTLMGGTPEEKPEAYRKSSAITYLDQVISPLLIIQGYNDMRCPPRSIEVYEQRARKLGKPIEVIWFDAGHGSHETEERIAHQEQMLRFARQNILEIEGDLDPIIMGKRRWGILL